MNGFLYAQGPLFDSFKYYLAKIHFTLNGQR
jgi:hypothetical protein